MDLDIAVCRLYVIKLKSGTYVVLGLGQVRIIPDSKRARLQQQRNADILLVSSSEAKLKKTTASRVSRYRPC